MNARQSTRFTPDLLPASMSTVAIAWGENSTLETYVENYCTHGIRVSITSVQVQSEMPKKNDIVKVQLTIEQIWFTGMCIYTTNENDGTFSLGIYFYNPSEQNHLHSLLNRSLIDPSHLGSFVSYEWEELVTRMCNSEDRELIRIGNQELEKLKVNNRSGYLTNNATGHS